MVLGYGQTLATLMMVRLSTQDGPSTVQLFQEHDARHLRRLGQEAQAAPTCPLPSTLRCSAILQHTASAATTSQLLDQMMAGNYEAALTGALYIVQPRETAYMRSSHATWTASKTEIRRHLMVEDACREAKRDIRARSHSRAMAVRAADAECEAGSPGVARLLAPSRARLLGRVRDLGMQPNRFASLSCVWHCVGPLQGAAEQLGQLSKTCDRAC